MTSKEIIHPLKQRKKYEFLLNVYTTSPEPGGFKGWQIPPMGNRMPAFSTPGEFLAFITVVLSLEQVHSHGVAWGDKFHPYATGCQLLATPGNIFVIFCCCFIFLARERSLEIPLELNLGLSDLLQSSILSCTYSINLIVIT